LLFRAPLGRQKSVQQSVDQDKLAGAQGREGNPGEKFARPKAALAGFTEAELNLQRADFDHVPVPQEGLFNRLAIDVRQRLRMRYQQEAVRNPQMKLQVPIPDAIVLQAKIGGAVAPNHKRKPASEGYHARVGAGKNLKLNH